MSAGAIEQSPWLVVIGYGNELRGDDGAGPRVARAVQALNLPGVKAIAVHQLMPELADEIAVVRLVLFVDASADPEQRGLRTLPLTPEESDLRLGHFADPRWLLELTRQLHGRAPEAQLLTIAAPALDFGEELSPPCQRAVEEALRSIVSLYGISR